MNKTQDRYENVQPLYAENEAAAADTIAYYESKGYSFLNCSQKDYAGSGYAAYAGAGRPSKAMELDRVIVAVDEQFFHGGRSQLSAVAHISPEYLYRQLFDQGVEKVREKIALLVVGDKMLFSRMMAVFNPAD